MVWAVLLLLIELIELHSNGTFQLVHWLGTGLDCDSWVSLHVVFHLRPLHSIVVLRADVEAVRPFGKAKA